MKAAVDAIWLNNVVRKCDMRFDMISWDSEDHTGCLDAPLYSPAGSTVSMECTTFTLER